MCRTDRVSLFVADLGGSEAMTEEPVFIERRTSHLHAALKSGLNDENHATDTGLLTEAEQNLAESTIATRDFPVVCVGGSAGGLDAYTRLLPHLPADIGVAIVIVNHLRIVATQLHEILPRYTKMPVKLITEGLVLEPNQVFIIPAQRDLHVLDGEFRLKPMSKPRGWPDVITVFLRSLTQHWNGKIIAVIVSGYDGDGAAALCGIKEVGGITIAQRLDTAGQPEMPESAVASGFIDFVLSPEEIAREIIKIAHSIATLDHGGRPGKRA
jgi:two-component system chemotaxis response regulator CheB